MGNSPLAVKTVLSPNHSGQRTHKIQRITPHCVVGKFPVETIGNLFSSPEKEASCNYAIAEHGEIVVVVDEQNRSWCTSSEDNDQKAVTVECSCDRFTPYTFPNEVYESLVNLTVDVMQRNGMNRLLFLGTPEKSVTYNPAENECILTVHRWFANKACPGDWFMEKIPIFVEYVNSKLENREPGQIVTNPIPMPMYCVQTGAFKSQENAISRAKKLNDMGYTTWIVYDEPYYKIQCGAYREKENAYKVSSFLTQNGIPNFIKVK